MKKRLLCFLLSALLVFTAVSCMKNESNTVSEEEESMEESKITEVSADSSNASDESEAVSEVSEDISEEVSEEIERTWPVVSGTFIQPGSFVSFTEKQWTTHFKNLLEVGIDTLIIQWTAETPQGLFKNVYYPSEYAPKNAAGGFAEYEALLPTVLKVAEEMGVKVFVGLNLSDEWWSQAVTNEQWNKKVSSVGVEMAKEIHSLYKVQYPNALYGWYFAYEMFNGMMGYEKKAGEFLNMYLAPLTQLDASMPMMLSPYVRSAGGDGEKAGREWTKVFETANFREGDIFCCQDAVGAGHITIDKLESYFSNLKKAVDTEKGLLFWANSECFTQHPSFVSAPVGRFIRQMEIAKPYVSGFVTFAYSHYYAKDFGGHAGYHYAYKHYYMTGEVTPALDVPTVEYSVKDGEIDISAKVKNNGAGIMSISFKTEGRDAYVYTIPAARLTKDMFAANYHISKKQGETAKTVTVTVTDYYGNTASKDIKITF